jgi:uncharacterized tellurite resistance protein B-like protein
VGAKRAVGCVSCVRAEVYKQSGLSLLIGWFSPVALVLNPLFIVYGLGRGLFVFPNPTAVRETLQQAGIPDPGDQVDIIKACYALGASMVNADGKIDPKELETAKTVGAQLLAEFDPEEFEAVARGRRVPDDPYILAGLLRNSIGPDGRRRLYEFLLAIAGADGEISPEEQRMLDGIRVTLNIPMPESARVAA